MIVKREERQYNTPARVWTGSYKNSHNSPHWHYDCELLSVENGGLKLICGNDVYELKAGQSCFIDSEKVHCMHAEHEDTTVNMVVFDYDIIKPIVKNRTLASPVISHSDVSKLFDRIKPILKEGKPYYEFEAAVYVCEFIIDMFRTEETTDKEKPLRTEDRLKLLIEEIDNNFEFCDLNVAADFMGMTPTYFSRLFHRLTGITFIKYLNLVKCEKAVELIKSQSNIPVTEVSLRCGFDTIRSFNRTFKSVTGYTPKALPSDYILKSGFTRLIEKSADPTDADCLLIDSSDKS